VRFRRGGRVLGCLALAAGVAVGFGGPPATARAQSAADNAVDTFVGTLNGLDAYVAIVSDGTGVVAYVCDGGNQTLAEDFAGGIDQAENGVLSLQGDKGTLLQLNIDATTLPGLLGTNGHISGTVLTTDGHSYGFSTDPATGSGGLYHADPQTVSDGSQAEGWWVRLNSGGLFKGNLDGLPGASACAADFQDPACLQALALPLRGDPAFDEGTYNLALTCLLGTFYSSTGTFVVGFPVWPELSKVDPVVVQQLLRQVDQQPSPDAVSAYQTSACVSPTPNAQFFTDRGYGVPPIYGQPGGTATVMTVPMALTPAGGNVTVTSARPSTPPVVLKVHRVKKEESHHHRS
jgi:hypothetical protein